MEDDSANPNDDGFNSDELLYCGVVMPISQIDSYDQSHWQKVFEIIAESLQESDDRPKFKARRVNESLDARVIHGEIVKNLFYDPMIICDVSGKNPNVMFELGMRLAFDKPAVIIQDSGNDFSFDTGVIEHIQYPPTLDYHEIKEFKISLASKVANTYQSSKNLENRTFLQHFGDFTVSQITDTEIKEPLQFIINELEELKNMIASQREGTSLSLDPKLAFPEFVRHLFTIITHLSSQYFIKYYPNGFDPEGEYASILNDVFQHVRKQIPLDMIDDRKLWTLVESTIFSENEKLW